MNDKSVYIIFGNKKLENEFEGLKKSQYDDKQLYSFIDRALKDLKANPSCGTKIEKRL